MSNIATIRRTRYGLGTAILVVAVVASCVIAGLLGSRYHLRWDVTSTRQHTLSPRTLAALAAIGEERVLVVSADLGRLDRVSAARMSDLLGEFSRRAPLVRTVWINTGSQQGREEFSGLIASLAVRDSVEITRQVEELSALADRTSALAASMDAVSQRMKDLAATLEPGSTQAREIEGQAGVARTFPTRLAPAIEALRKAAEHSVAGTTLPAVDLAAEGSREGLTLIIEAMRVLGEYSRFFDDPRPKDAAVALGAEAQRAHDEASRIVDQISRLKPTDPLIVARVLQAGDAVLITGGAESGGGRTVAIDFASIFPSVEVAGARQGGAESAFAGEQLITTALASLSDQKSPILVFVHAEEQTILDEQGGPTTVGRGVFGRALDRMRLSRVQPAEWALANNPVRPDLRAINPKGDRPVVWLVMAPPSVIGVDAQQPGRLAMRNARVAALAKALEGLIASGERLMVCVDPSDLPAVGERDPLAAALAPLGLSADTARPLLRRESLPAGQVTYSYLVCRTAEQGHPLGQAVDGLAIAMPWATSLQISESLPAGVRVWPLLRAPVGASVWGESQWLGLRTLEARGRVDPLSPPALVDPPTPDAARDLVAAPQDGWIIAAAAERAGAAGAGPQRALIVASPAWLHELFMRSTESAGGPGRTATRFPGNTELFEAGIYWLAGRDEMIAPGPQTRDVPRIMALGTNSLSTLRWAIILGPALATLLLGALLRVWRG